MLSVETNRGKILEELLPEIVTENGLSLTADELGVSKATLGYWLLKLQIHVQRVAILPGDVIVEQHSDAPPRDIQRS